jgi:hypothetical protein
MIRLTSKLDSGKWATTTADGLGLGLGLDTNSISGHNNRHT